MDESERIRKIKFDAYMAGFERANGFGIGGRQYRQSEGDILASRYAENKPYTPLSTLVRLALEAENG